MVKEGNKMILMMINLVNNIIINFIVISIYLVFRILLQCYRIALKHRFLTHEFAFAYIYKVVNYGLDI